MRNLDDRTLATIQRVRGVMEFLGPDGDPTPLRQNEIEQLLGAPGESRSSAAEPAFAAGDVVGITSGPFSGFEGKVISVNDSRGSAQVEIEIFGRPTPAEVEFRHLRKA